MATAPKLPDNSLAQHALDECRNGLLETLAALIQDYRLGDMKVLQATQNSAREQFEILAGMRDRKAFEAERSLTASRISLVHEEDLEFSIRLSDLAQQIRERCEVPLGQLHLRFMTILGQQEAAPEQLPVGPETVCCALRTLAAETGLDPDARLQLLQNIRDELSKRLASLYEKLNARLDALGIEQKSLLRPASERPDALRRAEADSLARKSTATSLDPILAGALRDRMLAWLEDQFANGTTTQVARQLGRTELAGLLPDDSRLAVEQVEQALDRIAAHTDIPVPGKHALETLRVPLLKLALREAAGILDPKHAARLLLDALVREASELPNDAVAGHPQLDMLASISSQLALTYHDDESIFNQMLSEVLQARRNRLDKMRTRVEQHARGMAHEERNELSRRQASTAIRALCEHQPPKTVRIFLEHYWSVVLRRTLMNYGEKSDEWRQALKAADTLVWSMLPKTDAGERDRLIATLPKLVQKLQNGLEAIRVSPESRERIMTRFTALHTEALHGRDPKLTEPAVSSPPEEVSRIEKLGGSETVSVLRRPGYIERDIDMPEAWRKIEAGQTIRFLLPDGTPACGSVAQISPQGQVWMLERPDGSLLAITWSELVHQQQAGTASYSVTPELFPR